MSLNDFVSIERIGDAASVMWAVPTSGYGHVADEQSLPFITDSGEELTPRLGGEPDQCPSDAIGLPWGKLSHAWPWRQRMHNWPRRALNRYWREVFQSRNRHDGRFLFWEQLNYRRLPDGFQGDSPMVTHQRAFKVAARHVEVLDELTFKQAVHFEQLVLLALPLHQDWCVGQPSRRWVEFDEATVPGQWLHHSICTPTGTAVLWCREMNFVRFEPDQRVEIRYSYHF
jgi:hypothetical protein